MTIILKCIDCGKELNYIEYRLGYCPKSITKLHNLTIIK